MREKIKLESTAGTGHFYTTDKNKKARPTSWKSKNLIRSLKSMSFTKKPNLNK